MKRLVFSEKILKKIVIYLFTINISLSVLPGGFTGIYGLFGEMTSVTVVEHQESVIRSKPIKNISIKNGKVIINNEINKALYAWLLRIIIISSICYLLYWLYLNYYATPVALKVRMNN